ncbi:hypothetical protein [Silvibacterium acidisoli]|uniref:hypothetical protein n=1 Tax=Acidobacteriaceae bacterium ZG23-2 TaxID=2883246 RepID=UPI00406D11F4
MKTATKFAILSSVFSATIAAVALSHSVSVPVNHAPVSRQAVSAALPMPVCDPTQTCNIRGR